MLRVGRYGPYIERDGQRASVPEDLPPAELTVELAEELLAKPSGDFVLGTDPSTGLEIVAKDGATARTSPRCCPRTRRRPRSRGPARCSRT